MSEETKTKPMFAVGDRVRIKTLETLIAERGEHIPTPCSFTTEMRTFCGDTTMVTSVRLCGDGVNWYYRLASGGGWNWDECVLEDAYLPENDLTNRDTLQINYDDLF